MSFSWRTDWPQMQIQKGEFGPINDLPLATKRPWRGCVQSSGGLFTDGTVMFRMRYLAEKSLAKELKEKTDDSRDRVPSESELEQKWGEAEQVAEDGYVAKTRGYVTCPPQARPLCKKLAVVSWKNYQRHWSTDAKLLLLVKHIVGKHKTFTDDSAVMTFQKPSGNVAAAMQLYTLPLELED